MVNRLQAAEEIEQFKCTAKCAGNIELRHKRRAREDVGLVYTMVLDGRPPLPLHSRHPQLPFPSSPVIAPEIQTDLIVYGREIVQREA